MDQTYIKYALAFKAVSDESRLKIINMLSCGEMCACDILEKLNISQSTLSYHMKILTESGLIDSSKNGSWMRYSVNHSKIEELKTFLSNITNDKDDCSCKNHKMQNLYY